MKKTLLTLALVVATGASSLAAIGTVQVINLGGAPVNDLDGNAVTAGGNPASGSMSLNLYWLNPATDTFEVRGAAFGFMPVAGVFSGGVIDVPTAGEYDFEIRAWETSYGSYEAALDTAGAIIGESGAFTVTTGNPDAAVPPTGIAQLFPGMTLYVNPVPEPSTIALGVLGVGALLLLRRRK